MRLVERYEIPAPPGSVSGTFEDVQVLARHVPGALISGGADGGPFEGELGIAFGPRVIKLRGTFTYDFDPQSGTGRLAGSGTDRRGNSRATGHAIFSLGPANAGAAVTQVQVEVDLDLTGPLSSIAETGAPHVARAIFAQFSESLMAELGPAGSGPPAAAAPGPEARPVSGFRLALSSLGQFLSSVRTRLRHAVRPSRRSAG
jgi:carbon monoxide dehydrogenase subunit G